MILKVDCTEHSLLAIEVKSGEVEACNIGLFPHPLDNQFFIGHVTSSNQGFSQEGKAWERGCLLIS